MKKVKLISGATATLLTFGVTHEAIMPDQPHSENERYDAESYLSPSVEITYAGTVAAVLMRGFSKGKATTGLS